MTEVINPATGAVLDVRTVGRVWPRPTPRSNEPPPAFSGLARHTAG